MTLVGFVRGDGFNVYAAADPGGGTSADPLRS